jgi:CelD/BcsL family acetyltransferase involved in cellulose biosynthesis
MQLRAHSSSKKLRPLRFKVLPLKTPQETIDSPNREIQIVRPMTLYSLDPLADSRWSRFIERHPASSVFHTTGWLAALRSTYDYKPIVFTTTAPENELQNGLVFTEINSWLTGKRIVSLPFSDHCDPLLDNDSDLDFLVQETSALLPKHTWKYLELRPLPAIRTHLLNLGQFACESFAFHSIDLRPETSTLFKSFHKSCVQRKITRAEREGLRYEAGSSKILLDQFYALLLMTRRRHQLPPQPRAWFQNLADLIGEKLCIHAVYKDQCPIAAILTIRHKDTLVYKYGGSDARFHKFGGMIHLFWKAIQQAKLDGIHSFDLGRSELSNEGLIEFKSHWGAPSQTISYFRFPHQLSGNGNESLKMRLFKSACGRLPNSFLELLGTFLYRHVG